MQTGEKILSGASALSCIVTLIIPITYYFKNKNQFEGYTELSENNTKHDRTQKTDLSSEFDQSALSPPSMKIFPDHEKIEKNEDTYS